MTPPSDANSAEPAEVCGPRVVVYRTTFTDVADGDYVDPDTESEAIDCTPDDDETAVDLAVTAIDDAGAGEPSSMPGFHPGIWYTDVDGSYISDYRTGERTATSAHLHGFTLEQEHAIWARVTGAPEAV